jgi:hypothetical protein
VSPGGVGEGEASMRSGQERGDGPATLAPRHLQHQSQTNSLLRISARSPARSPLSGALEHRDSRPIRSGSAPRPALDCQRKGLNSGAWCSPVHRLPPLGATTVECLRAHRSLPPCRRHATTAPIPERPQWSTRERRCAERYGLGETGPWRGRIAPHPPGISSWIQD